MEEVFNSLAGSVLMLTITGETRCLKGIWVTLASYSGDSLVCEGERGPDRDGGGQTDTRLKSIFFFVCMT